MSRLVRNKDIELLVQKLQTFTSGATIHERNGMCGQLRMCVLNYYAIDSPNYLSVVEHAKVLIEQLERGDTLDLYVKFTCSVCKRTTHISVPRNEPRAESLRILARIGWKMGSNSHELYCPRCTAERKKLI